MVKTSKRGRGASKKIYLDTMYVFDGHLRPNMRGTKKVKTSLGSPDHSPVRQSRSTVRGGDQQKLLELNQHATLPVHNKLFIESPDARQDQLTNPDQFKKVKNAKK